VPAEIVVGDVDPAEVGDAMVDDDDLLVVSRRQPSQQQASRIAETGSSLF
jgi:hypothetical protein